MKKHLVNLMSNFVKSKGLDINKLPKNDKALYLFCINHYITNKKELFNSCSKMPGMDKTDDLTEVTNQQMVKAIVSLMKDGDYHVVPDDEDNFIVLFFNQDEISVMHQVENGEIIV